MYDEFKAKQRDLNWTEGDAIALMIDKFGESVIKDCASHGWGKPAHLKQIARVSRAFTQEQRFPDVSWSFFRAAYQVSTRVEGESPYDILTKALDLGWSLSDLNSYGKDFEPEFLLVEQCKVCGTKVSLVSKSDIAEAINCPVCILNGEEVPLGKFAPK